MTIVAERDLVQLIEFGNDTEDSSLIPTIGVALEIVNEVFNLGAYCHTLLLADFVEYLHTASILRQITEECTTGSAVDDAFEHSIVILYGEHLQVGVNLLNEALHCIVQTILDVL